MLYSYVYDCEHWVKEYLLIYVVSAHSLLRVCLLYLCACVLLCMNMNVVCFCAGLVSSVCVCLCVWGHICASFCCERLGVTTLLPLLGDLPHRGLAWAEAEARVLAGE